MATALEEIISGVQEDIAARQEKVPLRQLEKRIAALGSALDATGWLRKKSRRHPAIIAEIKRKSPSKGRLATIDDPTALARIYEASGAAAISVLTEERRFGGSLSDLEAIRRAVTTPVLRKDFMVEEYQFHEARAYGADLVLLIVAALEKDKLYHFSALTRRLGMKALVEVHTEEEAELAVEMGAELIGVNVRDLKTLQVDSRKFAPLSKYIVEKTSTWGEKPVVVAESGVSSPFDVRCYCASGADAVLVGEALVKAENPGAMIKEFTRLSLSDFGDEAAAAISESSMEYNGRME